MDGIRFILEDPQAANSRQKKRSRLVTACDTCRAKKIKCHQSPGASKCEACRLSKSACRFRDRERYHAQRSGSLSASSSTFGPSDSEDAYSYTGSPGIVARRATLPTLGSYHAQHGRSSSLPPAMPRLPGAHRAGSPNSEIGPHRVRKTSSRRNVVAAGEYAQSYESRSGHSTPALPGMSPLIGFRDLALDDYTRTLESYFDASRPGFPAPKYMEHALELFFEHFGPRFLFLHHEALRHTMLEQALPAPFANCISALSLRFSQSAEVSGTSRVRFGDPYLEMAKDLIVPLVYNHSVENLHALLLLSWCEYGSGRENGLNLYSALAVQMAIELGLGNEDTIQSLPSDHERMDLRQTWYSVVQLDMISSWITGNPANLSLQGCTTAVPSSSFLSSDLSTPPIFAYLTLHELLGLRDNLIQIVNFNFNANAQEPKLQEIRTRLLSIQLSLPSHLEFNLVNLRHAAQDHQDTVFIFLHVILNSLIAMAHCPSLFRPIPNLTRIPDVVISSARTILDVVVMLEQIDPRAVTAIPFLDFPLAIAARAFALESRAEQDQSTQEQHSAVRGRFAGVSHGVCNNILSRLAENWGNVQNVQMAVQSGTVWTYISPINQSPVAIPSALDLQGIDHYHARTPALHVEHAVDEAQELALTYSDSEISRETSPLMFDFPSMLNTTSSSAGSSRTSEADHIQRPSSDPTPTTMLPPVSLAGGEIATYEDFSKYMTPFTDEGHHASAGAQSIEYFSAMHHHHGHASECIPLSAASVYGGSRPGDSERNGVSQSYPPSPWLLS